MFPRLSLEAHPDRCLPSAVVAHGHVLACDEVAEGAGIAPGMRLSTARGMLPELAFLARDPEREARLLSALACWAGNLSPEVCPAPPATLLVEIGGCLRLFGGTAAIVQAVHAGCGARGVTVRLAAAVTPLAAEWLARGRDGIECPTREALPEALSGLPIEVLDEALTLEAGPDALARLHGFGVRRLRDLLALPRAGLERRLGSGLVRLLARGLGEVPDPRARFAFPEQFAQSIELPGPAGEAPMLAFPARRLVDDFCGWLAARQLGATGCVLELRHERLPEAPAASTLDLRLAGLSRDAGRFGRVLRERLDRLPLPAPVHTLTLRSGHCAPLTGSTTGLFDRRQGGEALEAVVERLRARLGEGAVHGMAVVADHRPECSTRSAPVGTPVGRDPAGAAAGHVPRPLLLLPQAESLPEVAGRPHRQGRPLELLAGPERIESGWWDAGDGAAVGDVRRDYFVARPQTPAAGPPAREDAGDGEWLWIYRDGAGWHLQGVFA